MNKWVSVEEETTDTYIDRLVLTKTNLIYSAYRVYAGTNDTEKFFLNIPPDGGLCIGDIEVKNVTHWMEMPDRPETNDD